MVDTVPLIHFIILVNVIELQTCRNILTFLLAIRVRFPPSNTARARLSATPQPSTKSAYPVSDREGYS